MADFYVYVPFSGATGGGKDCYNNNCNVGNPCLNQPTNTCTACGAADADCVNAIPCKHCSAWGCCPVDLPGAQFTACKIVTGTNVQSIKTTRVGGLCTAPAGWEWVREGVRVDLYCALNGPANAWVGTVFFGHMQNRVADGVYNASGSGVVKTVGTIGGGNCCGCYTGSHVHLERLQPAGVTGATYGFNYGASLPTSQWLFRFTKSNVGNCV